MEEDIKILEGLLGFISVLNIEQRQALENLLKRYRELEKQNEGLFELCHERFEEIAELTRQKRIKDNYLQLIHDIGFDYDGMGTKKGLKSVIDDLVDLAIKAIKNDDKYAMYQGDNDKYFNILYEEIKKEDENG